MLSEIFKTSRWPILATYLVMVIENIIFAFYPFLFGKAIDGLMSGNSKIFHFYLTVMLVGVMVGTARRMVDTRIFAKVWKRVGTDTIMNLMDRKVESSKVITRAGLSTRYVDFFEFYLPDGFRCIIWMGMAIVMLWMAVTGIMVWLLILAGLAIGWARFVSTRRKRYDHIIMDSVDQSNKAIQEENREEVMSAYDSRTKNYIKSSDWEAGNWGLSDVLSMAAEAIVVLTLVNMKKSTGEIIATVAYVEMLFRNIGSLAYFFVNMRSIEVANEKIADA